MRELYFYHHIENMYEELLNDCYDPVEICGYKYDQGHALRNIDAIAFGCGVAEWASEEFVELSFAHMTAGERDHYMVTDGQRMYCKLEDKNVFKHI